MAPDDHAYAVPADGARPCPYRGGVRALLGAAEDTGVGVRFTRAVPGRSFPYVRGHRGDSQAPSDWADVLAQPGIGDSAFDRRTDPADTWPADGPAFAGASTDSPPNALGDASAGPDARTAEVRDPAGPGPAGLSDGYAYAVLADGARPYLHRGGVRALLGAPEDTGVGVSSAPTVRGRSLRHVHQREDDPAAPSGRDDLPVEPGTALAPPASRVDPAPATAGITTPARTGAVERAWKPAVAGGASAGRAEALSRDPEPNTVNTVNTAATATATTTAVTAAPGPPVVTELVIPGGPPRPAASGTRPRTMTTETRQSAPGPARQEDATTAVSRPETVLAPTARNVAAAPVPPSGLPRAAPAAPGRSVTAPAPAPRSATEMSVSAGDSSPHVPEGEPRNEPARSARSEPTRGPRDGPSTVPRPGPAVRVPSGVPRDRRPVAGATSTGAPPRPDAVDDLFTPWTDSARRHPTRPYRKDGPPPSATPQWQTPRRQTAEPAPTAAPAVPRPPAPAAVPAPPQVLVVRAPAAPTGEAAFWERRHLGRLLKGVVR